MALAKCSRIFKSILLRPQVCAAIPHTSFKTTPVARDDEYEEYMKELPEFSDYFPDDLDVSMGMYRKELIARLAGVVDPFDLAPIDRKSATGTKIDPYIVTSALESRMLTCECEPEMSSLLTIWVHQNEPRRCRCGYWFVLQYREPFVEYSWPY